MHRGVVRLQAEVEIWELEVAAVKKGAEKQVQQLNNPHCPMSVEALQAAALKKAAAGERDELRNKCGKLESKTVQRLTDLIRMQELALGSAFSPSQSTIGKGCPTPQEPRGLVG